MKIALDLSNLPFCFKPLYLLAVYYRSLSKELIRLQNTFNIDETTTKNTSTPANMNKNFIKTIYKLIESQAIKGTLQQKFHSI